MNEIKKAILKERLEKVLQDFIKIKSEYTNMAIEENNVLEQVKVVVIISRLSDAQNYIESALIGFSVSDEEIKTQLEQLRQTPEEFIREVTWALIQESLIKMSGV